MIDLIAADIVLIAAGWGGKVHIQSSATGEYLCFTKKGKLVTKVSQLVHS